MFSLSSLTNIFILVHYLGGYTYGMNYRIEHTLLGTVTSIIARASSSILEALDDYFERLLSILLVGIYQSHLLLYSRECFIYCSRRQTIHIILYFGLFKMVKYLSRNYELISLSKAAQRLHYDFGMDK